MNDLSLHILDLVQNSIKAEARNIGITVIENSKDNLLEIEIADDGLGIPVGQTENVLDPFVTSRKSRRVGLGLPLINQAAEMCNGKVTVESALNNGTKVKAAFTLNHVDRPPLGYVDETITVLIAANPEIDFVYKHLRDSKIFAFDTSEIRKKIKGVSINNPAVLEWIREFIKQGIDSLDGGV